MKNKDHCVIKTPADIQKFLDTSNSLHDGYITRVEYNNTGISAHDNGLSFDYSKKNLIIHVLVTSLPGHPTFEIVFRNILEWQINECQFSDTTDCSILFLDNGLLLWANDSSPVMEDLKQGYYVVAESIQYRQL